MKKLTLLSAALLAGGLWCANAQLNNPVGEDGYYIVRWDCANDTWAAANDFEVDETFTIAVDVTGTPLETWLKGTSEKGGTRAIAINRWTNMGDFGGGDCNRLKQIKGNIYGATYNFAQLGELGTFDVDSATVEGTVVEFSLTAFGYEYNESDYGLEWYAQPIEGVAPEGKSRAFVSNPYTGTRTDDEFYNDEYEGLFPDKYFIMGYAPACAVESDGTGVETVLGTVFDMADVVATECYNLQGQKLGSEPISGLYIKTFILNNGSRVSQKMMAVQQ